MPWTPQQFASRHNHSLSPEEAAHASRIANAILRGGASERIAIATANKLAEHHAQKRAAGGPVGPQTVNGLATPLTQQGLLNQQIQSAAMPSTAAPSYLAGTAGSPVNAAALPQYTAQVPSSTGINSAGFMNVPQTGSYQLDPMTGALTPATQQALQMLAQRGLTIGSQPAAPAAPAATPTQPTPGQGGGTEGAGNAGNEVGAGGGGGSASSSQGPMTMDIIGGQGPSIGFSGSSALAGAGKGAIGGIPGGPAGMALGALAGGLAGGVAGGSSLGTGPDIGAQTAAGDIQGGAMGGVGEPGDITDAGRKGGGRIKKRANGGQISPSMESPWWTRSEARASDHPSGLIQSPIGGRSDHIPMALPSGSYVVPSDIMSGIGQGNGLNGAHRFDQMISSGPFGTKLPSMKMSGTLPRPPSVPKMVGASHFSRGGRTKGRIPVIVAGGERVVSPEEVMKLAGDLEKGHRMLDEWVVRTRKEIIDVMKKLPGPAR